MRLRTKFFISFAVMIIVFSISLTWVFRDGLLTRLPAALEDLNIAFGPRQVPDIEDKKETFESEFDAGRSGIDETISELMQLAKSRRELNKKVSNLKDEISILRSEIDELEYVILNTTSEVENDELQRDLTAMGEEENEFSDEDSLVEESEPTDEISESRFYTDANDQMFREYFDFYVDWLTDTQSVASENQKAYVCRNSNVSQFLAVNEDAALREACNITGYNRGIIRNNFTGNQKSFLCRNLNVTRFLSAFKNVAAGELCGD